MKKNWTRRREKNPDSDRTLVIKDPWVCVCTQSAVSERIVSDDDGRMILHTAPVSLLLSPFFSLDFSFCV